jgi:hypothetical protein
LLFGTANCGAIFFRCHARNDDLPYFRVCVDRTS